MAPLKGIQGWQELWGVIVDSKGNVENSFNWGLGRIKNNQVETLALYQGTRIVDERHYKRPIAIRDSQLVIKSMSKTCCSNNSALLRMFLQVKKQVARFESVEFFHALRAHHRQANSLASRLECGNLRLKTRELIFPIP